MHFSLLTRSKKTAHDTTTDDTHDYLVSVAQELGINISNEKKRIHRVEGSEQNGVDVVSGTRSIQRVSFHMENSLG